MSGRSKFRLGLVAVPAVCLSVGLWTQYRSTTSSVRTALWESAWSDLEHGISDLASSLDRLGDLPAASGAGVPEDVARLIRKYRPTIGRLTLADSTWVTVRPSGPSDPDSQVPAGSPIQWERRTEPDGRRHATTKGFFTLPDGSHFGIALAIPGWEGRAIIHQPVSDVERRVKLATASLPAMGMLTFLWTSTVLGVAAYLLVARFQDIIKRQRDRSSNASLKQIQSLLRTRDAIIFGLAKLAESRDPDTGEHLERIAIYSATLATTLRRRPEYYDQITPSFVRLIGLSAALHDIGKVGIRDDILLKSGPLTPQERKAIECHATIGGDCLRDIERRLGGSNFLSMAKEIAYAHHESWDGRGYPNKLSGTDIALAARIVALADMYDALSSRRVYKPRLPHEECVTIIRGEAGRKLDPSIVDIWLTIEGRFRTIAAGYTSAEPDLEYPAAVYEPEGDLRDELEDCDAHVQVAEPV